MLLKIDNLQKNYKDFQLNCSLEVLKGRVTGVIGGNGAGKTTTFKAVLGLIFPESGRIELFGKEISEISREDKMRIGTVMAETGFSSMLNIKEIIGIMDALYPAFQKAGFLEKCRHYQLPIDKAIKDFSTGMKAKLKVLLAMSYDASLLILDEPTLGLDYMTRNEIIDEMRDFMANEEKGILISSHISSDLEGICDDLYFLHEGKIKLHEDTDKILSDYGVLKLNQEQYACLQNKHSIYKIQTDYGFEVLTNEKQYFTDNYPDFVMEKGSLDQVIRFITKGVEV